MGELDQTLTLLREHAATLARHESLYPGVPAALDDAIRRLSADDGLTDSIRHERVVLYRWPGSSKLWFEAGMPHDYFVRGGAEVADAVLTIREEPTDERP